MAVRIVTYESRHASSVKAFNERLRIANSLPFSLGEGISSAENTGVSAAGVEFKHFVAEDDLGVVRGGYFVRNQRFLINGQVHTIGHYTSPLSEGIIDRRYTAVGLQMLLHALRWQPLLFAMGMGGFDRPLPRMLMGMGWKVLETPFYFQVLNGRRFLLNVGPLRKDRARRLVSDVLAFSGLGPFVITVGQKLRTRKLQDTTSEVATLESYSEDWLDEVWRASAADYSFSAIRDRGLLEWEYLGASPQYHGIRLSVNSRPVGWVSVLDCRMSDSTYFGGLKVMAVVDGIAPARYLPALISAAVRYARQAGADLIFSNQMHCNWIGALQGAGFWRGPSNYLLAVSKPLAGLVGTATDRIHFNRGDGDGCVNLV